MMRIVYTLKEGEIHLAEYIGHTRELVNRYRFKSNRPKDQTTMSPQKSREVRIRSFGAEIAAAAIFNRYPDLTIWPRYGGGGFDFILQDGRTVDVKSALLEDMPLKVDAFKIEDRRRCDLYILVAGKIPTYRIMGFAEAKTVFDERRRAHDEYGDYYFVPVDELKPIEPPMVDWAWLKQIMMREKVQ